jgi:hypothetical protein
LAQQAGWPETKCEEMFTLGYLHDIGYEFSNQSEDHPKIGGTLLKNQGYKYWREVFHHGAINGAYSSNELDLLNMADLTINSHGENVGVEQRLLDIKSRYGSDSHQYLNATTLAKRIGILK